VDIHRPLARGKNPLTPIKTLRVFIPGHSPTAEIVPPTQSKKAAEPLIFVKRSAAKRENMYVGFTNFVDFYLGLFL